MEEKRIDFRGIFSDDGAIKKIDTYGDKVFYELKLIDKIQFPFETKPTLGNRHDYKVCEVCQYHLKELTNAFRKRFYGDNSGNGFPNCCEHHKPLNHIRTFDLSMFKTCPENVALKIIYVNQHVINFQDGENFYNEITDYLEWTIQSLGIMPQGCGEPLFRSDFFENLKAILNSNTIVKEEVKKVVYEYIDTYNKPIPEGTTDLNILIETYNKWLKSFPFDLSFFQGLREKFFNQLPLFNGEPVPNLYSGLIRTKLHTKTSLLAYLANQTNDLLTEINTLILYEQGQLKEVDRVAIELAISKRRSKLNEGYLDTETESERKYRSIIKKWFKDEIEFINALKIHGEPHGNLNSSPVKNRSKIERFSEFFKENGFFKLPMVEALQKTKKDELVTLLVSGKLPYAIAMMKYLGFIDYIEENCFKSKFEMYRAIDKLFNPDSKDKKGRNVQGQISVLNSKSTQNKERFTSHLHIEKVKKDYQKLK